MQVARPGQPPGLAPGARAPMPEQPEHGTSHISVVDGEGRALALTSTIEAQFGARVMADGGTGLPGGHLLNNPLPDFSFTPADAAGPPVGTPLQRRQPPRPRAGPT